eukprot:3384226-Pleurochrysis_carterae.AAC.1
MAKLHSCAPVEKVGCFWCAYPVLALPHATALGLGQHHVRDGLLLSVEDDLVGVRLDRLADAA